MDYHRDRRKKTIVREIQERIEGISRNIDKLQKELNLYQKIKTEIGDNNESEIDYSEAEDTLYDTSVVIIPERNTHLQLKK
jgi:phosphopantetheine adenylyltransferase